MGEGVYLNYNDVAIKHVGCDTVADVSAYISRDELDCILAITKQSTEKKPDVDPEVKSTLDKQGNKLRATFYKDGFKTSSKELIPDIKNVIVYNDKVVTVEFADGTTEKAVLHPDDQFSIEQGISICITKKLVGGSSIYNKLVERALKVKKDNDDAAQKKLEEENARKERAKKWAAKKAARKAKKRECYINLHKEAFLKALTEFGAGYLNAEK